MAEHIVMVDDDPVTAKIIGYLLEDEGYAITILHRGDQVVDTVTRQDTDLVILDVNLPDTDGFSITKLLRAQRFFGPILILTGRANITDKVAGFQHGADDYITKPFEPLELLARVSSLIRRAKRTDLQPLGTLLRVDDAELSIGELSYRSAVVEPVLLTPTEMKLLEVLMRNSWIVIGREKFIERIWGYDFEGDTNRVDVYIRRIRRKIEPDPKRPQYLHTIRGVGYMFRTGSN